MIRTTIEVEGKAVITVVDVATGKVKSEQAIMYAAIHLARMWGVHETLEEDFPEFNQGLLFEWAEEFVSTEQTDDVMFFKEKLEQIK